MTKNLINMHFLVKLLGLLADWELKWSPVFSTYLLLQSRSFLMPFARNIFGCAQSLIRTASWGYSLFAIWHPYSAVWKSSNYVTRDLEYMLHGRESKISIFFNNFSSCCFQAIKYYDDRNHFSLPVCLGLTVNSRCKQPCECSAAQTEGTLLKNYWTWYSKVLSCCTSDSSNMLL
jgi:hypothetical protein